MTHTMFGFWEEIMISLEGECPLYNVVFMIIYFSHVDMEIG